MRLCWHHNVMFVTKTCREQRRARRATARDLHAPRTAGNFCIAYYNMIELRIPKYVFFQGVVKTLK